MFRYDPKVTEVSHSTAQRLNFSLRHFFRLLASDDSRELDYFRRRIAVLAQSRFEGQLTVGDLTQGNIGVTHARNELDQRTMSDGELPNTA